MCLALGFVVLGFFSLNIQVHLNLFFFLNYELQVFKKTNGEKRD